MFTILIEVVVAPALYGRLLSANHVFSVPMMSEGWPEGKAGERFPSISISLLASTPVFAGLFVRPRGPV